ncbi:hypothetical protein LOCC1_G006194 [Lachnellula occidentalis]|uniref:Cupin type-2 domain-containing protein n=1 Tax=Lachnellula occidentalis TaxID=215460 RepID=A0A8H8UBD0_9HELO|nr:hypothetical protein LOCC1_G006194 [Lachnellula occidentalis]
MPGSVQVTKSTALDEGTGQTEGMIRQGAIIDKSDKICASVMVAKPHTSSAVHHHGEQDTIIYAQSGHGIIISNDGSTRQALHPGDFALIPAWTEHQEANEGDDEVVWIISRSGGSPVVVNLEGWGGKMK